MTNIVISMPESLKQFVDRQVDSHGYPGASEYFQDLVAQAIHAERKAKIEALLLEGVEAIERGEVTEMTAEDWQRLRDEYLQKIGVCQGSR